MSEGRLRSSAGNVRSSTPSQAPPQLSGRKVGTAPSYSRIMLRETRDIPCCATRSSTMSKLLRATVS